jgi:hypothetical protein
MRVTKPIRTGSVDLANVLARRGYVGEAKQIQKADAERRANAKNILDPNDLQGGYDAARLLYTTLGGQIRPITAEDLRAFTANAVKLGKRFKGGITAQGVIDHSLQEDRDRANFQIRSAVLARAQAGKLHFITNAGLDSDVNRHHVFVEFPAYKSYAAFPGDSKKLAKAMLDSPLKFECDCGRFTFWYRYLATKGGFVHGRPETGFPKIRNPKLVGVACKHSLRVMLAVRNDMIVRIKVAEMIAAAQRNDHKALVTTKAEAQQHAEKQLAQEHHLKNRLETSVQAAARKGAPPAVRKRVMVQVTKDLRRKDQEQPAKDRDIQTAIRKIATTALTRAERDDLIALLKAKKTTD